jgi:hypothetical protein
MEQKESKKQEMDMRYTAEQLKARLVKELPIMRQNHTSLVKHTEGILFSLPMIIHNISLCVSERVYLFIEPTLRLYKTLLPKHRLGVFKKLSNNEKEIEKRITFLEDLVNKEHALYNEQLDEAKADIKREKKNAKDDAQPIIPLSERIESFRHIEIDMYEFLYPYMVLVTRGEIEQTEQQLDELHKMQQIALSILTEFIPKREKTLVTCNTVLSSYAQ